jgi:hypothetical protein
MFLKLHFKKLPRQEVATLLDPGRNREPEAMPEGQERTRAVLAIVVQISCFVGAVPVGEVMFFDRFVFQLCTFGS